MVMFEQMTDSALQVVARASTWSRTLGHRWLGTEHLLAAMVDLASSSPLPASSLTEAGIGPKQLHPALLQLQRDDSIDPGDAGEGMLRFTRRAAAVLRSTPQIAAAHGAQLVTVDHMLAAVVADRDCRGAQLLAELEVDLDVLAVRLAVPTIARRQLHP